MVRISRQVLNECRIDLYDQCSGLADTLQVSLADFVERRRLANVREIGAIRSGEPCVPINSIPRLAIIMLALQDQVNAAYFRQMQDDLASDVAQGELFDWPWDDDDYPF